MSQHRRLTGIAVWLGLATCLAESLGDFDPQSPACQVEINALCSNTTITPGRNRLLNCLKSQILKHKKSTAVDTVPISAECRSEVLKFRIHVARKPLTRDFNFLAACSSAIGRHCQKENSSLAFTRGLLVKACLIRNKPNLDQDCKQEVLGRQIAAAENIKLDPALWDACSADANSHCSGVKAGNAQLRTCLKVNKPKLSANCSAHLFASMRQSATDVRLNYKISSRCGPEMRKFCPEVEPGNARILVCLTENKHNVDMSPRCKEAIEHFQEDHSKDFRLDARINKTCADDIQEFCRDPQLQFHFGFDPFDAELGSQEGIVLQCLKLKMNKLKSRPCQKEVHRLIKTTVGNIRLSAPLYNACKEDSEKLCKQDRPDKKDVLFCLNDKKDAVSDKCKAQLFKQEVIQAHSVDFNLPMRQACKSEIQALCKGLPRTGAVIKCLQDRKDSPDMSTPCRETVVRSQRKQASDYRLNPVLQSACQDDISEFCEHITAWGPDAGRTSYQGQVIACLKENTKELNNDACRTEITRMMRSGAEDFRNNVVLANKCKEEVAKFCKDIKPGSARVIGCLSSHKDELGDVCKEEVHKTDEHASENVLFNFPVLVGCRTEIKQHCAEIKPGGAAQLTCLRSKMREPGFSSSCKGALTSTVAKGLKDYRLDAKLKTQCKADVGKLCSDKMAGKGEVVRCIVEHYEDLEEDCKRAAGLVVRGAFRVRNKMDPTSIVAVCDPDMAKLCPSTKKPMATFSCLTNHAEKIEDQKCKRLLEMTQASLDFTPKMLSKVLGMARQDPDSDLSRVTSLTPQSGITLTGPIAFAAVVALVACVIALVVYIWKSMEQRQKGYTQFVPKTG